MILLLFPSAFGEYSIARGDFFIALVSKGLRFSIPVQWKLLDQYAKSEQFKIVREFVDVETAKKLGRTGFDEIVKFLKRSSSVHVLLVEKTDRLYRNLKDYVTMDEG